MYFRILGFFNEILLVGCNMSEKLFLKWNDFQINVNTAFGSLREVTEFADVTLACEDMASR